MNLPSQATPFVGRGIELAELAGLLANADCRLLTLVGPGGIGKTRLALEIASRHADAFAEGAWFAPLQEVSAPDYLVFAMAEALEFEINQCCDPQEQVAEYLSDKRLLLTLDNFEHLLDGAPLVSDLLAAAPGLKILVTSREALNLQEEWLWPLAGLRYPDLALAQDGHDLRLDEFSAVQLFAQSAQRVRADFSLDEERVGVIRICALVEGMPLGLELAAVWVKALSCDEIASEIQRSLDFLETRARNVEPRHRSMRVVLDHSWDLLPDAEKDMFMRLSVFRGSFTREAAAEVAGAGLADLTALMDKSLLRRDPDGRYDLHELVRQYAERHLNELLDESGDTRQRHVRHYLGLLERRRTDLFGSSPQTAMREIEREIKNIRVAWGWAAMQLMADEIGRALDALWFFYDTRGWYREGEMVFELAVEVVRADAPEDDPPLLLGKLVSRQGVLRNSLTWFDEARALLGEGLAIARRFGDEREIGFAQVRLGEVAAFESNYEKALRHIVAGLRDARAAGDRWGEAYALHWLGLVREDRACAEQAETIFRELDSRWGIAVVTPSKAFFAVNDGNYDLARAYGEEGLAMCQEIGIRWGVGMSYEAIGYAQYLEGAYRDALGSFDHMLRVANETQLPRYVAVAAYGIGRALLALKQRDDLAVEGLAIARHYFEQLSRIPSYIDFEGGISPSLRDAFMARSRTIDPEPAAKALKADLEALISSLGAPDTALLTEREIEIVRLVADGFANRDIADRLFLSTGTVKWYLSQVYSKLGVSSRTQAVARAREMGWVGKTNPQT
jgi:predicted ATPase/DNA-binding CsgD family transcriptional regulator